MKPSGLLIALCTICYLVDRVSGSSVAIPEDKNCGKNLNGYLYACGLCKVQIPAEDHDQHAAIFLPDLEHYQIRGLETIVMQPTRLGPCPPFGGKYLGASFLRFKTFDFRVKSTNGTVVMAFSSRLENCQTFLDIQPSPEKIGKAGETKKTGKSGGPTEMSTTTPVCAKPKNCEMLFYIVLTIQLTTFFVLGVWIQLASGAGFIEVNDDIEFGSETA